MWGDTNFVTKPYREMKHVFILGGLEDVFTLLEDNQVLLQTMMGSRFIAGVQVCAALSGSPHPRLPIWGRAPWHQDGSPRCGAGLALGMGGGGLGGRAHRVGAAI
jgi:hypothetical protein